MKTQTPKWILSFDVESIGLHGESFAFGAAAYEEGNLAFTALHSCKQENAHRHTQRLGGEDRDWVKANVPLSSLPDNCTFPHDVRHEFLKVLLLFRSLSKGQGVLLVDCGFPVESRFLAKTLDESGSDGSDFLGPQGSPQWIDVYTLRQVFPHIPVPVQEKPHHPLDDAMYAAQKYFHILNYLGRV